MACSRALCSSEAGAAGQNGLGVPGFGRIGLGPAEFDGMGALGQAFNHGRRIERESVLHGSKAGSMAGGASVGLAGCGHGRGIRLGLRDCMGSGLRGAEQQGQGPKDLALHGVSSLR